MQTEVRISIFKPGAADHKKIATGVRREALLARPLAQPPFVAETRVLPPETLMRKLALNLTALAVATTLSVLVVEGALRTMYPKSERHFVLPPNDHSVLEPIEEIVPGVYGAAEYRTSSLGIRGEEMGSDDEYRILAIGGSTTQNAYLDQSETWTLMLGEQLAALPGAPTTWTGDVGRSGHTARSHVLQLERLLPELPGVDAVVMLLGVNDLTRALRMGWAYDPPLALTDPSALEAQVREAFLQVPGGLHDRLTQYGEDGVPFYKRTAIYQLARLVRNNIQASRAGTQQDAFGRTYETWRAHRAGASAVHDSLPDLGRPLEEYRGLLTRIARSAKALDVRLVLVTQPVFWRADLTPEEEGLLWLGGIGDFQSTSGMEYFSAVALAEAMDAYNTILLDVCRDEGVECVDLAGALPKTTEVFYDDVHFTERGSALVTEHLVSYLAAHPPYASGG